MPLIAIERERREERASKRADLCRAVVSAAHCRDMPSAMADFFQADPMHENYGSAEWPNVDRTVCTYAHTHGGPDYHMSTKYTVMRKANGKWINVCPMCRTWMSQQGALTLEEVQHRERMMHAKQQWQHENKWASYDASNTRATGKPKGKGSVSTSVSKGKANAWQWSDLAQQKAPEDYQDNTSAPMPTFDTFLIELRDAVKTLKAVSERCNYQADIMRMFNDQMAKQQDIMAEILTVLKHRGKGGVGNEAAAHPATHSQGAAGPTEDSEKGVAAAQAAIAQSMAKMGALQNGPVQQHAPQRREAPVQSDPVPVPTSAETTAQALPVQSEQNCLQCILFFS